MIRTIALALFLPSVATAQDEPACTDHAGHRLCASVTVERPESDGDEVAPLSMSLEWRTEGTNARGRIELTTLFDEWTREHVLDDLVDVRFLAPEGELARLSVVTAYGEDYQTRHEVQLWIEVAADGAWIARWSGVASGSYHQDGDCSHMWFVSFRRRDDRVTQRWRLERRYRSDGSPAISRRECMRTGEARAPRTTPMFARPL
jgi:hypothetical protein